MVQVRIYDLDLTKRDEGWIVAPQLLAEDG
jgi:hypothetical protein